jgi:hypothetical protein
MLRAIYRRVLIGGAVCSVALAACGGDSGVADESAPPQTTTGLSAAEYVERADALCERIAADVEELDAQGRLQSILSGTGTDDEKMAQAADVLEEQLTLISEFRADVEALGKPSVNGEDVEQISAKSREAEVELESAIDSLRAGNEAQATEALQSYAERSLESAEIAQASELGFEECGSGA